MKNKKLFIFLTVNYLPSKTIAAIRNNYEEETIEFIIVPNKIGETFEEIERYFVGSEELTENEIKNKLFNLFNWLNKLKEEKKDYQIFIVLEKLIPQINYVIYKYIKENNFKIYNDIN